MYADFIKERFERCLDLYLCPRTRRKRLFVPDAKALVPKLPKPRDLQPFPTTLALRYLGHQAAVSHSPHPSRSLYVTEKHTAGFSQVEHACINS